MPNTLPITAQPDQDENLNNKERLSKAALELFAQKGFAGTSIRDIASATGISLSNIYHHFGNKNGLLLHILTQASSILVEQLGAVAAQDLPPLELFSLLLRTHIRLSSQSPREAKIFFMDEEHLSREGHDINLRFQRDILDIYRGVLMKLRAAGLGRFKSPSITAFNILGVINWKLRWYRPEGSLSVDEVSEEILDFVLHGIVSD